VGDRVVAVNGQPTVRSTLNLTCNVWPSRLGWHGRRNFYGRDKEYSRERRLRRTHSV